MRLSMHGKRKRSQGTLESELVCPSTSPLTHKNLEILNIELAAELASSTNNHPPPFDIMAHQSHSAHSKTPTTNSTPTTKTQGTSLTNAEHILNLYRFFVDRNKQLPAKLEELVCRLKSSRQCDITPNSKAVHIAKQLNQGLSEGMELHVLMDKLLYRAKWFGDGDLEGEPLITQGRDDQWSDRLPRPDTSKDHDLAAAMEKLGLPKKPKPDMTFGYNDEAFPDGLKAHSEPSAVDTCIFSLVIYARHCEYRVHWRRVDDDDGTISYEGDIISQAFFNDVEQIFKTRGVFLKTLEWARGSRLKTIQDALRALGSRKAVHQVGPLPTVTTPANPHQTTSPAVNTYHQVVQPHTPPHSSTKSPQSRPEKRQWVMEATSSDSDDPFR
ncbi:MAG: hypothetical protein L6R41_006720 [Letrouitia leprolyta]|nr:MAG: hypothetical protein L6R41_006720 [Letrouitia leprolyta]